MQFKRPNTLMNPQVVSYIAPPPAPTGDSLHLNDGITAWHLNDGVTEWKLNA